MMNLRRIQNPYFVLMTNFLKLEKVILKITKEDLWGKILLGLGRNKKKNTTFVKLTSLIWSFNSSGFTSGLNGSWVHWLWLPNPKIPKWSVETISVNRRINICRRIWDSSSKTDFLCLTHLGLGKVPGYVPRFQSG